jgi:ribosomal subunit interface protein
MQIQIHGKQIDVGDALRAHVTEKLETAVGKYAERAVDAHATFTRDGHNFKCDAMVHLPTGLVAQARASAGDIYAACDACMERLGKQLRRYSRRLKDHHAERRDPAPLAAAAEYVLAEEPEDTEPETLDPVIVAETRLPIHTCDVGEAVMRMELAHAPVMVFRNRRHGEINVVYRREDGAIGWVDPANLADAAE